jgi:DNA polymerase III alpha subunit (gram-positive type)
MFKDRQAYIVLDVETGGLDPQTHSILEISGILWKPGKVIQPVFDCYIKEENITTLKKKTLPLFHELWRLIKST